MGPSLSSLISFSPNDGLLTMFELRLEPLGDIILSMKKVLFRLVAFDNGAARLLNVEGAVSSAGVEAADADASNNLL